ncbi:methylmalonyl-CoA mutase [Nocardioides thalensis]|uniref:Methylmalonyl-CoA mutase n=1 Tax=Nocardioides thalensis TaxID=1914755 RepID=A0A853C6A7_9ACTN|nr:methylmalonyl-CoA mutase family protein [Nocardioides thalensis]NYJ02556.1 methylmalonyl-CoA mutase [Nocardioides thalensis]
MTDDAGTLALADEADRHTREEWEAAAAAVLRKSRRLTDEDPDATAWDKLTRRTLDGIAVTPLGTPDLLDGLQTAGRPTRAGAWDIRAHLAGSDAKLLNEHALVDLDGGVTSLWVRVDEDTDLPAVLDKVLLDLAPVVLEPTGDPVAAAKALLDHASYVDLHPATNLGADAATASGDDLAAIAGLAREAGVLAVVVDGTAVHDQGASDVQELAVSLLNAVATLRVLTARGLDAADAARLIEFRFAATDEQFPTIAKLRAARRLWARVLELSGVTGVDQRQHVVTSRPMLTKYDPYVNMLRTTVAAFAAGVGGADAVTVLPFDSPLGQPDAFGRRIARNVSHLLMDESHVHEVADPAGGAYAVEKLTDDVAIAAWELFGRLDSGEDVGALIAETVARREAEIAQRKRPITGLSEFPNLAETLPTREPVPGETDVRRYGASFEALRDAPAAEPVFLATLGTIAQHTARATFASNLFAAGGVAVEPAGPTDGVDALVAAYGGQKVVCLAGTDEAYAEWGEAAAAALRERGATRVVIAGKPTDYADDACALGVDALAFLNRTREALA